MGALSIARRRIAKKAVMVPLRAPPEPPRTRLAEICPVVKATNAKGATQEADSFCSDPARFPWRWVTLVQHYWLEVNAMTQPMQVKEDKGIYTAS
jgi:hypothetical protein